MNGLKVVVVFLASIYLLICAAMYFFQRSLQYFPVAAIEEDAQKIGLQPFLLESSDSSATKKSRLLGHFVTGSSAPDKVIIVFHGNGGNALGRMWLLEIFAKAGLTESLATVFAEYPGYGVRHMDEPPTEKSIVADAIATIDLARSRWPGTKLFVVGESLGTGVAVAAVAQRPVNKLVLISPFSSAVDVAAGAYPWLPVRLLMKDSFDSVGVVSAFSTPLLVLHGSLDRVVPLELGQKLFDAYKGPKAMKILPGIDHNDMAMGLIKGLDQGEMGRFLNLENKI